MAFRPKTLISLYFLLSSTAVGACPQAHKFAACNTNTTSMQPNSKRWYGVQPLDGDKVHGEYGPWPVLRPGPEQIQNVIYCFKDQRSQTNIENVANQAAARWAPAMV